MESGIFNKKLITDTVRFLHTDYSSGLIGVGNATNQVANSLRRDESLAAFHCLTHRSVIILLDEDMPRKFGSV
jgi:hypothetical protein